MQRLNGEGSYYNMNYCSFCQREEEEALPLAEGAEGKICNECAEIVMEELQERISTIQNSSGKIFKKPHEIKEELDKYVVGQEEAKKILSVAVYNHYKRINRKSKIDIQKTNVLMTGPSGSGKTYILQILAKILDVPFVIVDATSITEAGYVGEDVESILEKLVEKAGGDIEKAERGIVYIDEIDKIATENADSNTRTKDVGGRGVQESLLKIVEDSEVQIDLGSPLAKKKSTINTKNILFVCGGAFVGLDKIVKQRTSNSETKTIGFSTAPVKSSPPTLPVNADITQQDVIKFGLIPELVGRIPMIAVLNPLTQEDLSNILTKPKNAILKQYEALFRQDGVKVRFNKDAVQYIAEEAISKKVGARGLKGVIEKKMYQLMFDLPQYENIKTFTITKGMLTGAEPMSPKIS